MVLVTENEQKQERGLFKPRTIVGVILVLLGISFISPAFAMLVQFDHTVPPDDDWYFVDHGAVMTVDASLDEPYNLPETGIQTVTVRISATGGDFIEVALTETDETSGFFTFPTYIMFTTGVTNNAIPALHVDPDDRVTTEVLNPLSGIIPIEEDVLIKAADEGWPPPSNPNQPNKSVKLTGTDSDADGIVDSWETSSGLVIPYNGVTYSYTCDSSIPNDCPVVGKKDIYVEIDFMKRHAPDQNALSDVINAFQSQNINLHIQTDEEIGLHQASITGPVGGGAGGTNFDTIKSAFFGNSTDRTNANYLTAKRQVFHYSLWAHDHSTGGSGFAEIPGNDMIISLGKLTGSVGSRDQQAGTFMHELGHNLRLWHGGTAYDDTNCKPNYLSVMSYSRQFSDYISNRPLTFSFGTNTALNEGGLTESAGIGTANSGQETAFGPLLPSIETATVGGGIDWNRDGDTEDTTTAATAIDLNNFGSASGCSGAGASLTDRNDWSSLLYNVKATVGYGDGAPVGAGEEYPGAPFIIIPADQAAAADYVSPSDYIESSVPQLRTVKYEQEDEPLVLTATEEQKSQQVPEDECECEGLDDKIKADIAKQEDSYKNPENSTIPKEEINIEQAREFRALHVQAIDVAIQNLDDCSFRATENDDLECSGDAKNAKESLSTHLAIVVGHIKSGEDYAAVTKLMKAHDEARDVIMNPYDYESISAEFDGTLSSLKVASEPPKWDKPTLKELIDDIKDQSTAIKNAEDAMKVIEALIGLPLWLIALAIGLAIAVGIFIALTVMYRGRWRQALGGVGGTVGQGPVPPSNATEQK